eukprot:TRINITY_DN170_c0_g1_i2.p1 TRINITY_DN170_c0_g1~~TRINITY_DN170_c0_g1_i2.p1  ORF type:complete len:173 (+),score=29.68 TRINITY_DN170_c0_g1_i2:68-586(+)
MVAAMVPVPLLQRPVDIIFIIFFIVHIPTSLLIDSQVVLPPGLFPQVLQDLLQFHISTNEDFLVGSKPAWFIGLTMCELLVQVPYFFIASYAFIAGKQWIQMPSILYGSHVATTLIPILAEFWASSLSFEAKVKLTGIYIPYLIIPLWVLFRMVLTTHPFTRKEDKGKTKVI